MAANIRAGNSAVGPATGVLRAERGPATQCHLIQDLLWILIYFVAVHRAHQLTCRWAAAAFEFRVG